MTTLGLGIAGLKHRRLRTITSASSIAVAVAVLTVSLSATRRMRDNLQHFPPQAVSMSLRMFRDVPFTHVTKTRKLPDVTTVEWFRYFRSTDSKRHYSFQVMAASPHFTDTIDQRHFFHLEPSVFQRWLSEPTGMIVDTSTMEIMGWKEGDLVTLPIDEIGDVRGRIIGVYTGNMPRHAVMHYDYLEQLSKPQDRGRISIFAVPCAPEKVPELTKTIDELLADSGFPTITRDGDGLIGDFTSGASAVSELLSSMSWVIILITTLISATTVSMSLRERRGEMAALHAIGFSRTRLVALAVLESTLLCFAAGLVGAGIPFFLLHHKGLAMGGVVMSDVTVEWITCAIAISLTIPLGVLIALVPSLIATSKRQAALAMREMG